MSGKYTALARKKPSVPMRHLSEAGVLVGDMLDYGCGRGFDAAHFGMDAYDFYWNPDESVFEKKYDTITCNYVLNVVTEEVQAEILDRIHSLLKDGGTAYITVARHLKKDTAGRGCTQRVVILDLPVFIKRSGSFETYILKGG